MPTRVEDEFAHTLTENKIKRKGCMSNKRDKRLSEALHHKKGERWSDDMKQKAATYYLVLGNCNKVEKMIGVPEGTISQWRKTDWWGEMTQQLRDEHNDEIDAKITGIMDSALGHIARGLEEGDVKYDTKRGEFYNLPVSTKDKAVILGIAYDKRALLRGDPTSRTESISSDKRLKRLADQFEKFASATTIEGTAEIVKED